MFQRLFLVSGLTVAAIFNASAAVDLTGQFNGPVTLHQTASGQTISFEVTINNIGADAVSGSISVKPFLMPASHLASGLVNQKGVVLATVAFPVTLAGSSSTTVTYEAALPRVPANTYVLGGLVNSTRTTTESNLMNNATENLIDAGVIENNIPGPEAQAFDLYSDVTDLTPTYGGASHHWRLFKRGTGNTSGLRAIFLAADIINHKLYTLTYEKSVAWGHYCDDWDAQGNYVPCDIYTNSPQFENIPAGDYYLATLVNHTDSVVEADKSNNLDMKRMSVSHAKPIDNDSVWMVANQGTTGLSMNLGIRSQFSTARTWAVDGASLPSWLTMTPLTGSTGGSTVSNLSFAFAASDEGVYETNADLYFAALNETRRIPVKYFVNGANLPQLDVITQLDYTTHQPAVPAAQTLTLHNSGSAPLYWKVRTLADWVRVPDNSGGVIAPGADATLSVSADPQGLGVGVFHSGLDIVTNESMTAHRVTVNFTTQAH